MLVCSGACQCVCVSVCARVCVSRTCQCVRSCVCACARAQTYVRAACVSVCVSATSVRRIASSTEKDSSLYKYFNYYYILALSRTKEPLNQVLAERFVTSLSFFPPEIRF